MQTRKNGASDKMPQKPKLNERLMELGRRSQQSQKRSMSVAEVLKEVARRRGGVA